MAKVAALVLVTLLLSCHLHACAEVAENPPPNTSCKSAASATAGARHILEDNPFGDLRPDARLALEVGILMAAEEAEKEQNMQKNWLGETPEERENAGYSANKIIARHMRESMESIYGEGGKALKLDWNVAVSDFVIKSPPGNPAGTSSATPSGPYSGLGLGIPSGRWQRRCNADVVPKSCISTGGMVSITSGSSGTGVLAVIFFNPRNEDFYKDKDLTRSISIICSKCVSEQAKKQQKPEPGSMYMLDLAELANCMAGSRLLKDFRGLLVAEAKSHNFLAGGDASGEGTAPSPEETASESGPATSFPWGHIFSLNGYQPLRYSKDKEQRKISEQIPPLFFAVLPAPPR